MHEDVRVERKKIRAYWIGLCTYLLIFLNVILSVNQFPYMAVVIGAAINAVVIVGFVLLLRRAYRRIRDFEHTT